MSAGGETSSRVLLRSTGLPYKGRQRLSFRAITASRHALIASTSPSPLTPQVVSSLRALAHSRTDGLTISLFSFLPFNSLSRTITTDLTTTTFSLTHRTTLSLFHRMRTVASHALARASSRTFSGTPPVFAEGDPGACVDTASAAWLKHLQRLSCADTTSTRKTQRPWQLTSERNAITIIPSDCSSSLLAFTIRFDTTVASTRFMAANVFTTRLTGATQYEPRRHFTSISIASRSRQLRGCVDEEEHKAAAGDVKGVAYPPPCDGLEAGANPANLEELSFSCAEGEPGEDGESVGSATHVIRVPRILFFGGDLVSLTALEALCTRLECVVRHAFALQEEADHTADLVTGVITSGVRWELSKVNCHHSRRLQSLRRSSRHWGQRQSLYSQSGPLPEGSPEAERVRAFIRDHITVICPYLPQNITPAEAARRYSRQYPVARYCVEQGLTVVPVDHPRSLAKSKLLADMLGNCGTACAGLQHARHLRERQQHKERLCRYRKETLRGRLDTFVSRTLGVASAAVAPLLAGPTYCCATAPCRPTATAAATAAAAPTKGAATTDTETATRTATAAVSLSDVISTPWSRHGRPLRDFDVAVVVSFRYFIPAPLLQALPPTVNMHPSLLPRYRGASPIFTTLMRNDPIGGASVIQLRADQRMMDSGRVLWQCEVPIPEDVDIRTYMPLVTQLGAAGLCDTVFGEQLRRTPQWCQRHKLALPKDFSSTASENGAGRSLCAHSSVSLSTAHDGAMGSADSATVEPVTAPPFITPAVISAAMRAHRRYALLCEHCATTGTVPSLPGATLKELKCADVFPLSVRNSYCDWPDSFWFNWRTAALQQYPTYTHFKDDPMHAPLLPKDAAVLHFSSISGKEGFGVWRAFVGGQYFQPAVNATLDKACTPVRNQLTKRTLRRLVREKVKAADCRSKSGSPQTSSSTPSPLPATNGRSHAASSRCTEGVRGEGGQRRTRPTHKANPIDLEAAASLIDLAMLRATEAELRLSCTFTKALHPDRVPHAVRAELAEVELGHAGASGVRFFRAPPPLFVCPSDSACDDESGGHLLSSSCVADGTTSRDATGDQSGGASSRAGTAVRSGRSGLVLLREPELRMVLADDEGEGNTGGVAGAAGGACGTSDEEAPEGYVPDIILVAPPTPLPWLADIAEEVGEDYIASVMTDGGEERRGETEAIEGKRAESDASTPCPASARTQEASSGRATGSDAASKALQTKPSPTANDQREAPENPPLRGVGRRRRQLGFHIPTGTAYFPTSDESIGAIKCREGWFFWQEAHLKFSPRAQPAVLLRKGMAMRTGVLYAGLFSEYCK